MGMERVFAKILTHIKISPEKMKGLPNLVWQTISKVGREDPRRVIHSVKVGLSLTLVSLLYLLEPLFEGIGQNAIWAVMSVGLALEFTAGATLCKGVNRGFGTVLAGSLAFFIQYIAARSGRVFQAVLIATAVFLIGTATTYMKFFPYIKKNYDYGVVIFLLTFNLITVSSDRDDNVLKLTKDRFYTIAIGCAICLFMGLLIFPNWSGEDLHNSTVFKLEGLAKSIEACVNEYFRNTEIEVTEGKSLEDLICKGYKAILDSKSYDETLAFHASWEPRHSRHYKYPWQQYVKLGVVVRHFGYTLVALHGCLQTEIQTPRSFRDIFKDPCIRVAGEVSKALMELANSIRNRCHCSPELLSDRLHESLQDLNTTINSQPRLFLGSNINRATNVLAPAAAQAFQKSENDSGVSLSTVKTDTSPLKEADCRVLRARLGKIAITSLEFSEALPIAAFASLLVETVARLNLVIEAVEELGKMSNFKEFKLDDEIIVSCEQPRMENASNLQNHFPSHVE